MADTLIIDAERPWPWLDAFPETAERFFNGRDAEKQALLGCVLSAPVTVLFGKSGLGKSSLLQAGLFPLLRAERLLPVYVRLQHDSSSASLSEQIAKKLSEEIQKTQLENALSPVLSYRDRAASAMENKQTVPLAASLWEQLHRTDIELIDAEQKRWQPIIVLDQFEEIFSLGAASASRQKQMFYELGDLLENRIPKLLAERLDTDDALFDRLNLDIQPYRFLLSLREDYLPDLEEWSDLIPKLGPNRFRLLPMSANTAVEAIQKTGGRLVTHQDAENIVHYLSQTAADGEAGEHRRRKTTQIEPALLSLMCSGLNDERIRKQQTQLATDKLSSEGTLIVERFYDTAFTGLAESVRDFVEQHLITADGVRLAYPVSSIASEQLASGEELKTLIDKRLLRRESLEEGDRIELVHDRLAQVAQQRRKESQQRQAFLQQQARRRRWLMGVVGLMLILAVFAGYTWKAEQKARQLWLAATTMRLAVEGNAITAGSRPGSSLSGVLKVLAGHRLSKIANDYEMLLDEALQTEFLKLQKLVFMRYTSSPIRSVAFSPNGARIVSGSADNTLRLWDAVTGQPIGQPLVGHSAAVYSVAFSPDGSRIVSGSRDNTLRLWNTFTGQPIGQPLAGHSLPVTSVAFSPDGKHIASASADKTIRLWDASTGQAVGQPLVGHSAEVSSVAFNQNGARIVSGSRDNTLRLWPVFEGWADILCQKLPRNMTYNEWREWVSPDIDYIKQCPGLPIPANKPETNAATGHIAP